MTHTYNISGMTCDGCVAKAKSELLKIGDITEADVQLTSPQATITMQKHVTTQVLQDALSKAGDFTISEAGGNMHHENAEEDHKTWFATYKPILLIFFYISVITFIAASSAEGFDVMLGMRIFMSGFFLAFSFFKLLDLEGFANNYSSYDIITKRFRSWGYIYPFIELALGILYAANFQPLLTNVITFIVMTLSIIGVLQTVLNRRKIQCACLGAVFNLPMSSVTIIEDTLMIVMSGVMLAALMN
jgi:copper chaperone CopZ